IAQILSRNTRKKTPQAASCTHLIQHEVARPRVLIKLLDVVSVVALLIGETEKSLLQDRVSSVPQRERDAQQLAIIAEPGQAVLAPAIYSAARPVMLTGPCGEYDHPQSGLASFVRSDEGRDDRSQRETQSNARSARHRLTFRRRARGQSRSIGKSSIIAKGVKALAARCLAIGTWLRQRALRARLRFGNPRASQNAARLGPPAYPPRLRPAINAPREPPKDITLGHKKAMGKSQWGGTGVT